MRTNNLYDPMNPKPIFEVRFYDGDDLLEQRFAHTQAQAATIGMRGYKALSKDKQYAEPYWSLHVRKPNYGEEVTFG